MERFHLTLRKKPPVNYADWPSQLKAYAFTDPELVTALAENAPATMLG